jgi:hypothetical protein
VTAAGAAGRREVDKIEKPTEIEDHFKHAPKQA